LRIIFYFWGYSYPIFLRESNFYWCYGDWRRRRRRWTWRWKCPIVLINSGIFSEVF